MQKPEKIPVNRSRRRRGRPTRAEVAARALELVDPRAILALIASDPAAPAMARVAACRALLVAERAAERGHDDPLRDRVSARAIELLAGNQRVH
jgi:hypothetical protein